MPGIFGHSYIVRTKEHNLSLIVCVGLCVLCVCGVHRCMEIIRNEQGHVLRGPGVCGFETSGHLPLKGPTTEPRALMIAAPVDFVVRKEC